MSTIFEFCLQGLSPYIKEDLSIPISLGAVCSYWRGIAWSTPSLWSSLVVRVTRKHDPHMVTDIAHSWLSRLGQLSLSVRNSMYVSALVEIINQYSTRWSDLDLYIPDSCYQHFHATDNHAPMLKSIRFNRSICDSTYDEMILSANLL